MIQDIKSGEKCVLGGGGGGGQVILLVVSRGGGGSRVFTFSLEGGQAKFG